MTRKSRFLRTSVFVLGHWAQHNAEGARRQRAIAAHELEQLAKRCRPANRVTQHLIVMAERRGFEKALAARARGMGRSSITPYVNVFREPDLGVLEAMAEVSGVPVTELVVLLRSTYQFEGP